MAKKNTPTAAPAPDERKAAPETARQSSFDDIEKDRRKALVNDLYDRYYGTSRRRKRA